MKYQNYTTVTLVYFPKLKEQLHQVFYYCPRLKDLIKFMTSSLDELVSTLKGENFYYNEKKSLTIVGSLLNKKA